MYPTHHVRRCHQAEIHHSPVQHPEHRVATTQQLFFFGTISVPVGESKKAPINLECCACEIGTVVNIKEIYEDNQRREKSG